jgi:hypothetical protein
MDAGIEDPDHRIIDEGWKQLEASGCTAGDGPMPTGQGTQAHAATSSV